MQATKVAAALALLLVPAGAVVGAELEASGTAVEQHTSYVQIIAQPENKVPGYAAVAGIVQCNAAGPLANAVLWFNDEVFFRHGKRGPSTDCLESNAKTHVWATEEGAPDPRGNPSLARTGEVFEFTDPNGQHWIVEEWVYHQVHVFREESTHASVGGIGAGVESEGEVRFVPFYTWVVKVGEPFLDPTIEEFYNFVTIVDFEKLQLGPDGKAVHSGQAGNVEGGNSHNASDANETHRFPHTHDTAEVHLWVGGAPQEGPGEAYKQGVRTHYNVLTPEDIL